MPDMNSTNRIMAMKKFERDKLVAMANIQSREIRIMELEDEIDRCKYDIVAQNELIKEMEFNIEQQKEEMKKDKVEKEDSDA